MQSASSAEDCLPGTWREHYEIQKLWKFAGKFPFTIYADFETLVIPNEDAKKTKKHVPSGVSCLTVSAFPEFNRDMFSYTGPDVMAKFFEHLDGERTTDRWNFKTQHSNETSDSGTIARMCSGKDVSKLRCPIRQRDAQTLLSPFSRVWGVFVHLLRTLQSFAKVQTNGAKDEKKPCHHSRCPYSSIIWLVSTDTLF